MAGDRARIGVIGTGWWSTFAHLPSLTSYPDADVIGVADIDPSKAQQAADRFGVPQAFSDHRALLDLRPDTLILAVLRSPKWHLSIARNLIFTAATGMRPTSRLTWRKCAAGAGTPWAQASR